MYLINQGHYYTNSITNNYCTTNNTNSITNTINTTITITNGPAGLRGETTTNDPERGGASGVQPTEEGTRHPATHWAPLAACSCSH